MNTGPAHLFPIAAPVSDAVLSPLLALNNAHQTELSLLDDADYEDVNFRWFREKYDRFVYVDRIVVAPQVRGRGLARALYDDLIGQCRRDGARFTRLSP